MELARRGTLGALGDHIDSYAELLRQQHYSQTSAYKQLLVISRFSQWLQRHGIQVHKVDENTLQKFLRPIPRKTRFQSGDAAALNRLLTLLRQQKIVPLVSPSPPLVHGNRCWQNLLAICYKSVGYRKPHWSTTGRSWIASSTSSSRTGE
jgi:integrase